VDFYVSTDPEHNEACEAGSAEENSRRILADSNSSGSQFDVDLLIYRDLQCLPHVHDWPGLLHALVSTVNAC
jgi:hypothetical protein